MTRNLVLVLALAAACREERPAQQGAGTIRADDLGSRTQAALSKLDGEVPLPGLAEPVEILRDRWGIAHIYAHNQKDLFFAQGFVAAQDRLFQIDLWRRLGVGEMAAAIGRRGLASDRLARLSKFRGDWQAEWASYSPDTKEIATAFVAGINAYIDHAGDRLPIEFAVLGYGPSKWRPEDCLSRMPALELVDNFSDEIARARLIAAVGLERARQIAPTDPVLPYALDPALRPEEFTSAIVAEFDAATSAPRFEAKGSNNWAVAGAKTRSGAAMLANDPHRALKLPSLRYLVHLNAPGWNVIGSGEPALPGVALGHNDNLAWGFTIVGTDQSDLYVEETDPSDDTLYRVGTRWEKMTVLKEEVLVKGEPAPVTIELRYTRHGPVLYQEARRAYALRWVGSEPGTAAYLGSLAFARAQDADAFMKAVPGWKTPGENLVFADKAGRIGWIAAGLTPIRKGWQGVLPVPGGSGAFEWQGFVPTAELPQSLSPAESFVVTANQNIVPPGYGHTIATDWFGPSYRHALLRQRLASNEPLDIEAFRAMQQDVTALDGQAMSRILAAVATDPSEQPFRTLLLEWDGVLSVDSPAATLYAVWLEHLKREFYGSRVPAASLSFVTRAPGIERMLVAIESADPAWFGAEGIPARDRLVRETFRTAVSEFQSMCSLAKKDCAWGKFHTTTFAHPLASLGEKYDLAWSLKPVATPGGFLTPNQNRYKVPFKNVHGASYRQIFDLADWDQAIATSVPGQSGQPGSPHYDDLLPLWSRGEYFPLLFSRSKIEEVMQHKLRLVPADTK